MYNSAFKVSNATCARTAEVVWPTGGQVRRLIAHTFDLIATWHERARQRQHLAALDDHLLKDIGLTRVDVARETSKRFWEK